MHRSKRELRKSRHSRVRAKVSGTKTRPRMNVFRSLNHIYVQLIDDEQGKTLASASSKEVSTKGGSASGRKTKVAKAKVAAAVGKLAAEKAQALGIKQVTFDRGGYQYHGRVKELAEAARASGLEF